MLRLEFSMEVVGQQLNCGFCLNIFVICHSCYRGQKFCSSSCQLSGRKSRLRESTHRYQQSDRGRRHHQLRQDAYRKRKKNVTHHSSQKTPVAVEPTKSVSKIPERSKRSGVICRICGQNIFFFINEPSANPVTENRRKKRRKNDRNRNGGQGPPPVLR